MDIVAILLIRKYLSKHFTNGGTIMKKALVILVVLAILALPVFAGANGYNHYHKKGNDFYGCNIELCQDLVIERTLEPHIVKDARFGECIGEFWTGMSKAVRDQKQWDDFYMFQPNPGAGTVISEITPIPIPAAGPVAVAGIAAILMTLGCALIPKK